MAKSKLVKTNRKIAEGVVGGYKAVEKGVVGSYKKVEETVVVGYKKVEDAFVDRFLTQEGETVADAKARLHAEQEERKAQGQRENHGTQNADYSRQAKEHTMEQVNRAQEGVYVSEEQTRLK